MATINGSASFIKPHYYLKLDDGTGTSSVIESAANGSATMNNFSGNPWTSSVPSTVFSNPYALTFNGSSTYIDIPSSAIRYCQPDCLTMCFSLWFKSTQAGVILGQSGVGITPSTTMTLGYVPAIYIDDLGYMRETLFWHGDVVRQNVSSSTVTDGNWHHVMAVANGVDDYFYLDGTLQGVQSFPYVDYNGGNDYVYWIGVGYRDIWPGATGNNWSYFSGSIDDFRIYHADPGSDGAAILASGNELPVPPARSIIVANLSLVKFASANVTAKSTISTRGGFLHYATATITSKSTLNAIGSIAKDAVSTISSHSTLIAVGNIFRGGAVNANSKSTLAATSSVFHNSGGTITSKSTLTANGTKTANSIANLTTKSTLNSNPINVVNVSANISCISSLTAFAINSVNGTATLSSHSNITATVAAASSASLHSSSTLSATPIKILNAFANLSCHATLVVIQDQDYIASGGVRVGGTALTTSINLLGMFDLLDYGW